MSTTTRSDTAFVHKVGALNKRVLTLLNQKLCKRIPRIYVDNINGTKQSASI